jgi:hypothetical protein
MVFPVWNRPEMFKLCQESVIQARDYYEIEGLHTIFVVEYGAPDTIFNIIKEYPFEYEVVVRDRKFGLTKNLLEGFKYAIDKSDDWVMFQADDVVVHKTYYKYMNTVFNMDVGPVSTYYGGGTNYEGNVHTVFKIINYDAMGSVITKEFFEKYIRQHTKDDYYSNRSHYLTKVLDNVYKHDVKNYKFHRNIGRYNEQAGLINRLVDLARINDGMWIISPEVDRTRDIGFYGKNRHGNLPGKTYAERLENLRTIIEDPEVMKKHTPHYHRYYKLFNSNLDNWNGELNFTGNSV